MSHFVVAFVTTMIIIAMSIGFVKRFLQVYTNVTQREIFRHFENPKPNDVQSDILKPPQIPEQCQIDPGASFICSFGEILVFSYIFRRNPTQIAEKFARKKVQKGLDKCILRNYNLGNNKKFTKQTGE